ncbi:MAG: hypothetical protein H0T71_07655, partial [Acidobacteria bacterium]|nr:hypothetical protein [Acidobacteriota bacterium]
MRAHVPFQGVRWATFVTLLCGLSWTANLRAQPPIQTVETGLNAVTDPGERVDGPPPPQPPAMVARDDLRNVTIRTVRLPSPIAVDGVLDEPFYQTVQAASDFVQQEPDEGQPATDKTELWVFYDDQSIYIGARLWESVTGHRVTSDMRRDSSNLYNNDHLAVLFDTFYDRRNGFGFMANAQGGLFDWAVTNEQPNN